MDHMNSERRSAAELAGMNLILTMLVLVISIVLSLALSTRITGVERRLDADQVQVQPAPDEIPQECSER